MEGLVSRDMAYGRSNTGSPADVVPLVAPLKRMRIVILKHERTSLLFNGLARASASRKFQQAKKALRNMLLENGRYFELDKTLTKIVFRVISKISAVIISTGVILTRQI